MLDDLKAALRSFRSSKSFTIAALIVLTLGIGATTAIFSVVDAVVLRGLPFDEHDRIVAVGERRRPLNSPANPDRDPDALSAVAPQNYLDWAAQQRVFESIAAIASGWLTLHVPGAEPESIVPQRVTAEFFSVLRVRPAIGRAFTIDDEVPGHERVVILSDGLWRRRFGADAHVIGRQIPLEDLEAQRPGSGSDVYEVIGVMPPEFMYPVGAARPTDVWLPYVVPAQQRIRNPQSHLSYLQVIARLRDGVSLKQAQAQMDQVAVAIEAANPEWNRGNRIGVRPLIDHVVGSRIRSWMLLLLGAVGMVLLIACANVANLLLARASAREREVGIRAALGAGRWRLIRHFMTESLLLAAIGSSCAIVAASWAVRLLRTSMPDTVPRVAAIDLNLRVLGVAAVLSCLTALLFGVAPALQLSRPDISSALKEGARTSAGIARRRLRSVLVVGELALAVVLLVGAALFIGSFQLLMRIDPGIDTRNVLTAMIAPGVRARGDLAQKLEEVARRIEQIPGVVQASVVFGGIPLAGNTYVTSMTVRGNTKDVSADDRINIRYVTPHYHQALRISVLGGRLFNDTDRKGAPPVMIINESAARRYFPGENPIGRIATLDGDRTVVGIVGDTRETSLEVAPSAEAYVPLAQSRVFGGEMIVRTSIPPYDVLPVVNATVLSVLPDVPLRNIGTMEELVGKRTAQRRLGMLLLGLFGLLGLVIAAVGIYGVMAYLVAQRTREIGVRMALGATRSRVVSMVLVNAGTLVATGLLIGALAAWYLSAMSTAFLFELEPTDPRAFGAAMAALVAAAFIASVIPARRAASVDPMVALRSE